MEETIYNGFYSKDYGFNFQTPKGMKDYEVKDYMYNLNRGLTQDERAQYYGKDIPYDIGVKIAQRSKDKPDEEQTTFMDNVSDFIKSVPNLAVDLSTSTSSFIEAQVGGRINELLYDDPKKAAQATYRSIRDIEETAEKLKFKTKGTFWGEGGGSVAGSAIITTALRANPLVLGLFGTLNYEQNLMEMLEQGATFSEADKRARLGMAGEILLEKFGFNVASKYIGGLWKKFAYRYGTEGATELTQTIKDELVKGKYDPRSSEQKRKEEAMAFFFGGLGGALGFAISDLMTKKARKNIAEIAESKGYSKEEAKEIGLSVLDERGEQFRQEVQKKKEERINKELDIARGNIYDKRVAQGVDPKIAAQEAERIVPRYETLKNEVDEIINQGFKEVELEKLRKDYDEAIRIGGDKAAVYLKINDRLAELAKEAGYTEEESEGQRKILTSMFSQWYEKSDMSFDDFWDYMETRLELKDVLNEPIVGEGELTQEQIDKEIARREQLVEGMNIGKKGGRLFSKYGKIVTYKGKPVNLNAKGVKGEIARQLANGKTPNEIGWKSQEAINYAKDELTRLEPEIAVAKSKLSKETAKDIENEVNEIHGTDYNYTTKDNPDEQNYLELLDSQKEYQDMIDYNTKIMNSNFDDFGVDSGKLFSRANIDSTGQRITLQDENLGNFNKWFGNSKAVDTEGKPLRLYHGTGERFNTFKNDKGFIFLSTNKDVAEEFARYHIGKDPNIKEEFVRIENPYVYDAQGKSWGELEYEGMKVNADTLADLVKKTGKYDGVIIKNVKETAGQDILTDDYIVFNSNQIKSPLNIGTYDLNKNDTLLSRTDKIQGMYDRVNDIVSIAQEHNPDVFLHEMSHVFFTNYLPWLQESGRGKEAEAIYKLVGKDNIYDFTDEDLEKLTETFLQYVRTGNAPNLATQKVFEKGKDWIITQFRTISEDYEVSDEVKDFFDTLIANESDISELANVKTRITDIENSLKQHLNNQEVTFKGRSAEDIKALRRAYHKRIPRRKGENLAEHLRKVGGIEPDSELAKQLGYDSKKKEKFYKKGGFDSMDSLRDFLFEEGYLNKNEYDTYEQLSEIESEVENLIYNADEFYNEKNQRLDEEREAYLSNQAEAASVYDDLMKDFGLKSYDEVERVLAEVEKDIKVQNKDIDRLNKNAIKYIETSMKKARRDIQKTEKDVEKLKDKYANNIANLKQRQKDANETQYVLQQELTDKIRSLPINFKHQNALMKNIARVKDLNSYNRVVEDVMESAEKYADKEMKTLLINSINNMLKSTKIKGGKNTDYTYEGGKLFAELRGINSKTQNEAQNELDERIELSYAKDSDGVDKAIQWTEYDKMINRMLKFRADGMKANTDTLYDLALDLDMMIRNDIKERQEFEELKSMKRNQMRERMINSLESIKKGSIAERAFSQYLGDWHTINNEMFGKEIADDLSLLYEASNQTVYYSSRRNYEDESAVRIYGLKNKYEWLDKYEELKKPEYWIQRNDKRYPEQISKAQLMDLYLQMQNPETQELIMRNYETISEEGVNLTQQIPNLLENLTDQDKTFALMLAKKLQDDYDIENKAYIRRTGIDMPRIEGYFPRTSDYGQDVDTDYRNVALARPSYYKMRSGRAIPVFRDAIQKYREHIMEASYDVEMFDKYKEIYLTIMNSGGGEEKLDVKDAIKQKYGDSDWNEYRKYLISLSSTKYENKVGKVEKALGKFVDNWIAKNIGLNVQVFGKQLISIINYSENMPYNEYLKNLTYAFNHPKEAKALVEKFAGGEIKSRFEKGLQNETVASILNPDKTDRLLPIGTDARMKDLASWFVRKGDITPIIFGGYARIKYLQEQGMSDEEIKKIFVKETNRSQQSALSPSLSLIQKNAGAIGRMVLAYKNTALQYTRLQMEALTQFRRGEISEKQFAKTTFTYMVAGRLLYELSSSLLKGLAGLILGDDKKKKEAVPSVAQIATSPVRFFTDAVPVLDTAINNVIKKSAGGQVYSSGLGLSDDLYRVYTKFDKKKKDLSDYIDGGLLFSDLLTGWGLSTAKRQVGYFIPEKKNKL